jgi:hypothetical protein
MGSTTAAAVGTVTVAASGSADPTSTTPFRQTLRCLGCGLNQFPIVSRKCRRCHQPLDIPLLDPDPVIPDLPPNPLPSPSLIPPAMCPALLGINRCFPIIIYWLRLRSGLSQEELSIAIGQPGAIGKGISHIENGRRIPTVKILERMATALGTTPAHVLRLCEFLETGH